MGVLNSSRKAMKGFIEKSYSMGQLHGEMKKINDPRRQNLIETVHLTKAEENKIDTLFVSTYGKKIKYDWHRLYQSFTGKFDENYFPEYLFSSVLEPKMNPMDYRYVLDDKLLLPLFCVGVEHVRTPRTYYSVCDGICFDEEKNIVDLKNEKVEATVLLDTPQKGAANPWQVMVSPDNKEICVALSGVHEVCRIDRDNCCLAILSLRS